MQTPRPSRNPYDVDEIPPRPWGSRGHGDGGAVRQPADNGGGGQPRPSAGGDIDDGSLQSWVDMHKAVAGKDPIKDLQRVEVPMTGLQALIEMTKGPQQSSSSSTDTAEEINDANGKHICQTKRVRAGGNVQVARVRSALRVLGVHVPDDRKNERHATS